MSVRVEILWLWAVMVFNPGNKRLWEMSANYDSISDFVQAAQNSEIDSMTEAEKERAGVVTFEQAEKVLNDCDDMGIKYYSYESEGYPKHLKTIANPPAMLFFKGNLDFLIDKRLIVVVGTRKPSEYSLDITDKLCSDLIERGFLLVSGFAEGIDQRVNTVSMNNGSFPIAVCGTSINYDYPRGSSEFKDLVSENGVVISEYYPGSRVFSGAFVNRNRISVGISDGVLFVEAKKDSHGLDNYNHAVYQGKPVFVVPPHDIFDKRYFGQRDLIRNECKPIFSVDDIVYTFSNGGNFDFGNIQSLGEYNLPTDDSVFFNHEHENKKSKKHKELKHKKSDNKPLPDEEKNSAVKIDYSSLDDVQGKICRLLENENLIADDIAAKLELDISQVLSELTELELFGYVKSLPGKMFGL